MTNLEYAAMANLLVEEGVKVHLILSGTPSFFFHNEIDFVPLTEEEAMEVADLVSEKVGIIPYCIY